MKFVEILKKAANNYSAIAQEFQVELPTVKDWAAGESAPHPKLQRMIIAHVLDEKKIPCDCDEHKQVYRCPYHQWFEA